jgi:hypothetical protein
MQDEHEGNVRRLKMFDRASAASVAEGNSTRRGHSDKMDTLPKNTWRANEDTGNDVFAASGLADRLPSYSESSEAEFAPPAYSAGPSTN